MSNPYRPNDSVNWTGYTYDALGRTKQVQYADHSASQTSYTGTMTSVTDEAGKQKQYAYDGVGRLLSVQENPGGLSYGTGYQYDALDNLTLVTQGSCPGCQQRNFSYDGLGRLLSAANPESGTATYNYDSNGNLWHKTDGQGVTTTYAYDGLNRVTQKSYSNDSTPGYQTPAVRYSYDEGNVLNSVGRLTQIHSDVSTTEYLAYDALGRITSSRQDTSGQSYKFGYSYNLAGALTSETYPSGRAVSTGFDSVNRPVSVRGNFGGVNTAYASVNQYWPHGPAYKTAYGNQVVHSNWNYTPRLQPANAWDAIYDDGNYFIFDESMDWGGAGSNNGNLYGRTVYQGGPGTIPGIPSFGQSFSYDGVNRLTGVTDPGYTRQFGYDQWGNMAVTSSNGVPLNGTTPTDAVNGFDPGTNRLRAAQYDRAGNQTQVGSIGLRYDAENRQLTSFDSMSQSGVTYIYDGQGQRVAKLYGDGSRRVVYVYDALGQLAAEYTTDAANAPACQTCYLTYDHLGSVRVVTDQNAQIVSLHDYVPFGEEIPNGWAGRSGLFGTSEGISQRFTGQERDADTVPSLDFFQARYLSGEQGRFASPDPANAGADSMNPQSWNGYSYVWNNPLSSVDPSGMIAEANPPPVTDDGDDGGGLDLGFLFNSWFGFGGGGGGPSLHVTPQQPVRAQQPAAKNTTCSNLPAGTSSAFCNALQQGLQNALRALNHKSCSSFYGGQGPQALDTTQYRFLDMQNPTTGAATISPDNVFVNSKGPYMTYLPTPGQIGPFGHYWTQGQFRGFILLHELGHQLSPITGFKPDAGSPLNQAQSRQVLSVCF